ncbi:hypothetical protein [Bordetella flabilis]|uniref:Virulence factor n=1 Tax=Bordetella flabilis TaxID=463014 RepID=A0A193GFQ5_9BORD|nr:hypothetical protein [Bordetella flabilis]ANN78124.1 hypothetical protein BAU07_14390 [Bordetella flabilis]
MKRLILAGLAGLAGLAALGAGTTADAQVSINLGIGVPLYTEPPPVVYQPRPVYVAPPPVIYRGGGYWGHDRRPPVVVVHHDDHHDHHDHHGHHDDYHH